MGLLKEATMNEQAAAKVGIFGSQGSGKTTTGALIAIGLSKAFHNGAPVAMMDTENGSDFIKPLFDAEGIKLFIHKSRAFADMIAVLKEAQALGCCAFFIDSVTHTWQELQDSYCRRKRINRIEFQHWRDLKGPDGWASWTTAYLNSPLHCVVSGRAGNEYEYQINEETHKKELVKGASKMKAEGEFGYEPNLLIEMEVERVRPEDGKRTKGGSFIHHAHVLKDRARALNGRTLDFKDLNTYKAGDYRKVFDVFAPHWQFLNIGGTQRALDTTRTSAGLFEGANGEGEYAKLQRRRTVALEEIQGSLVKLWPGQSAAEKLAKATAIEAIFGFKSWTRVEGLPPETLEDAQELVGLFEGMWLAAGQEPSPENIKAGIAMCRERIEDAAVERQQADAAAAEMPL